MECFDFEDSEQIIAARRRLHFLTKPGTEAEADEMMDDDRSLELSVMTVRASNSSSSSSHQRTDLEGQSWYKRDGLGHEHVVSPNSSLLDVDGSFDFEEQDFLC